MRVGQYFFLEGGKRLGVPEEARHADEKLFEQDLYLLRLLLDVLCIGGRIGDLVNAHAPLDPAQDRGLFVVGKIMARPRAQSREDLLDGREVRVAQVEDLPRLLRVILSHVGLQLFGHLLHGHDVVRKTRRDRASGHAVIARRFRLLDHAQPARAVNRPHPEGPVGSRTRRG